MRYRDSYRQPRSARAACAPTERPVYIPSPTVSAWGKVHGYGHGSWTRHSKITAKTCLYLLLAYQLVPLGFTFTTPRESRLEAFVLKKTLFLSCVISLDRKFHTRVIMESLMRQYGIYGQLQTVTHAVPTRGEYSSTHVSPPLPFTARQGVLGSVSLHSREIPRRDHMYLV